ncbi:MAG: hypothetical protein KDD66_11355 [Bdellovibrionales bacterium]|nr:hypothetical protein [Bdellovibrionales bacterium]
MVHHLPTFLGRRNVGSIPTPSHHFGNSNQIRDHSFQAGTSNERRQPFYAALVTYGWRTSPSTIFDYSTDYVSMETDIELLSN